MSNDNCHVCPVALAGGLDNRIRRWVQNPRRILAPYVKEGMTVLDVGCGPGFFSIELAQMVGKTGRVIAADLQEGMLQRIRHKIQGTELDGRITLHQCATDKVGISDKVDFVLAFYMVHELPDPQAFFTEIRSILNPNGRVLVVEPPFHTSRAQFEETVKKAQSAGLKTIERPKAFLDKIAVLQPG